MTTICSNTNHSDAIVHYSGEFCPLCLALSLADNQSTAIDDLEGTIEALREEIISIRTQFDIEE